MHRTRLQVALAVQAQSTQRLSRPGHRRFQVNPAAHGHGTGRRFEGRLKPGAIKRRVDEDQVHTARRQTAQSAHRVAALHAHHAGFQARGVLLQVTHQHGVLLDHQHMGRATRCGLQAQHAGACKRVYAAPAAQVLTQPIEQGFAHPVGRGAQARFVQHLQSGTPPLPADDADLVRGRTFGHRVLGLFGGGVAGGAVFYCAFGRR